MKAEEIVNYLINSKGYAPHIAAGIAGNLEQESSLDPTNINPKSGAMGLAQWLGSRKTALQDYAMSQGNAPTDPYAQLDFLDHELNTTESKAMTKLLLTKNPAEAATVFSNHYERAGSDEANNQKRIGYAERAFNFVMPAAQADERILTEEEYNALPAGQAPAYPNPAGQAPLPQPQPNRVLTEEEYNALPIAPETNQVAPKAQEWEGSVGRMPESLPWSDVPAEAASNFIPSLLNAGAGVAQTFLHPIDTATNVAGVIRGGMQKVLPDSVANFLIKNGITPEARPQADALINLYSNRYGSEEGFKNAIAKDPASVLMDFATVLQGSGALLKGAGATQAGNALSKASVYVDPVAGPITAAGNVTGKILPSVLGITTGAGEAPIRGAYSAGKEGSFIDDTFKAGMRGKSDVSSIVDTAKASLKTIRDVNSNAYKSGMRNIVNDPTVLNFNNIQNAADEAFKIGKYYDKSLNPTTATTQRKIEAVIKSWAEDDPAIYHTAAGLDALKKAVQSIGESVEPRTPASKMGKAVSDAIKDEIIKQHPGYKEVMAEYSKNTKEANDIEKTFSLGKKPAEDTTIRKLQSVSRNNVYTNYGRREQLARKLDRYSGNELLPSIYGQALNNWAPRGLAGTGATIGGVISAAMSPGLLAGLPLTSPRIVGELSHAAGKTSGLLNKLFEGANIDPATLNRMLFLLQQEQLNY